MAAQNYTLGRGKVFFSRFKPGTQEPIGFRYIGNTPEFSLSIDSDNLDHYSSDEGIKEKDESIPLQVNRTGSFTTDNVVPDNIAMFFYGESVKVTQTAIAATDYTVEDALPGMAYQLGVSVDNPVGLRGFDTPATVKKGATALVENTDYTFDKDTGMLTILDTSTVVTSASDVTVNAAVLANTQPLVISGSKPVEGALRYIANNPQGANIDYYLPYVKIMPNGDYALKGDDWQTIPFNIEALKPANGSEAIFANGRPAYG